MRLYLVINTILNFESIYLTQILTMLFYFADMQLHLQQVRMLAYNKALFLHYMSVIFIRSELQKYIFHHNLITTNCDHIANQKIGKEISVNLSK